MVFNRQLNEQDRLSEYLSNRLSAEDSAAIEARLSTDQELQASYEALLAMKILLQSAPRRKVPHNFTISRQLAVKIRKETTTIPILRFSSALSALASIIVFAFAFFLSRPILNPTLMMAPAPMAEKSADAQPVEEPKIITWGDPANGMGGGYGGGEAIGKGGGGADSAGMTAEAQAMEAETLPQSPSPEEVLPPASEESFSMAAPEAPTDVLPEPTAPPEMPAPSEPGADSQRVMQPTEEPQVSQLPEITGSGPILGLNPAPSEGTEDSAVQNVYEQNLKQNSALIIVGLALVFLAVITGIAAILVSKRNKNAI
jgi:hypothetical protein